MAEGWNDKDSSENRLSSFALLLQYEGKSKNIQSSDSLIINALDLFVLRVICPLCRFPKNLKYPCPLGSHWVPAYIVQLSKSPLSPSSRPPHCWDKVSIP